MLMALGFFIFELRTAAFGTLHKTYEYRWTSTDIVSNPPMLQAMGKGASKADLEGVVYPDQAVPTILFSNPIEALQEIANMQEPMLMVDGTGVIHGLWAIKQISETQSYFDKFGNPKKIEFKLALEKYNEEEFSWFNFLRKVL
jgi:phage protein U